MGRKTFESLPGVLPNRKHIILTNNPEYAIENSNVIVTTDMQQIINEYANSKEEAFVIGGGKVYKELLPYCHKLYITEIEANDFDADTFFPEFNKDDYIKEIMGQNNYNNIIYKWAQYTKK